MNQNYLILQFISNYTIYIFVSIINLLNWCMNQIIKLIINQL